MANLVHTACLVLLVPLLVAAAVGDARRFIIPNELCLAIAALAVPWWLSSGVPVWPFLAWQLLFAGGVFAAFVGVFALGWMGGGDVKLFGALALWLPWQPFLRMMMVTAVAGGALTLAVLLAHRLRRREGRPEVPYGVAIACGALVVVGQGIVNPFAS